MKFHHIGIFVSSLKKGEKFFIENIDIKKKGNTIIDKNLKVRVKFLYDNKNICYELIAPFGRKNPVSKILKQRYNIINHIAYKTKSFEKTIRLMRNKKNFAPISEPTFAKAFKSRVIFFLTPLNFIVEIIEDD